MEDPRHDDLMRLISLAGVADVLTSEDGQGLMAGYDAPAIF